MGSSNSAHLSKAERVHCYFSQEGTDYEYVYYHHLHQFPQLVNQYPELYGPNRPTEGDFILPMVVVFVLLRNSDTVISPRVFDFLQQLPFKRLSRVRVSGLLMPELEALCCAAARRCINSLIQASSLKVAAFALELLALILPNSRLSSNLYDACFPGRPFAYTATGDHGLSALADNAYMAMQRYRKQCELHKV